MTLLVGDGSLGHPAGAPYDAINVAAAMQAIPPALPDQLAEGGRLVGPVDDGDQRLVLLHRERGRRAAARGARARALRAAGQRTGVRRGLGRYSRPTFAHGRPSTSTTSAVKSLEPRISAEPTP